MTSKWQWWLNQIVRRIWFRATLFSVGGVVTALLAVAFSSYIPAELPAKIGADAVDKILGIIASSMLTVTTFSLSTMVAAVFTAAVSMTARADSRATFTQDRTYEAYLHYQANPDKALTPARVIRWLLQMNGRQVGPPSSTEFQPIVQVHDSQVRAIATIAYKF